jgi:hypothetical protein
MNIFNQSKLKKQYTFIINPLTKLFYTLKNQQNF